MKKFLLFAMTAALVMASCGKINDKIDRLDDRLSQLEGETIPTIDEQIRNINTSIGSLEKTDADLKEYIISLQTTAADLQKQITATNTKLDEVNADLAAQIADAKSDLAGQIATAKSDVVAQLESLKSEMTTQLTQINSTIETLKNKDTELEGKIADLRTYVDNQIGSTKEWAAATFSTLEQYNAVVEDIATIKTVIEATNQSIADLETRLNTKIAADIATATATLDEAIKQKATEITTAYTAAIATAKEEITTAYTAAIADAIATLETSLKSWVNEQLAGYYTIAETDAKLSALKSDLESQLTTQKTYLENLISQLSITVNQQIADNTTKIAELRNELSGKIDENKTAIADNAEQIAHNAESIIANTKSIADNTELIKANSSLIEANSQLIAANKEAITALNATVDANTKAIAKNSQSIADNAALINTNTTTLNNHAQTIAANSTAIAQLQSDLVDVRAVITDAYTAAISTAVSESEGRINTKIANQIATVNTTIDNKIQAVNEAITALSARVTTLESDVASIKSTITTLLQDVASLKDDIAKLLGRIQSVAYIPQYTDGKVEMKRVVSEDDGIAEFDFAITPKEAVTDLVKVWQQAVTMCAVYTQERSTKAVKFIDLPILSCEANKTDGSIAVKVSGKNLSEDFFLKKVYANASLVISDGNSSIASNYVPIFGKNDTSKVDDLYTIFYTTLDNQPVSTNIVTEEGFVSNTYENGRGAIKFDRKITSIFAYAFKDCKTLSSITIPVSVTEICYNAFQNCIALTDIQIPNGVTSIGYSAFKGCTGLTSVAIPDSVTKIGSQTFTGCYYLKDVYITDLASWCAIQFDKSDHNNTGAANPLSCDDANLYLNGNLVTDLVIPDGVTKISDRAFYHYKSLTSVTIPDSVTYIGEEAFYYCKGVTSVILGNGVTSIGDFAFKECSITDITIPQSVSLMGAHAFECSTLKNFYGKFASEDNLSLVVNGKWAGFAYSGITEYSIPNNVLYVTGEAVVLKELKRLTIPKSVISIDRIGSYGEQITDVIIQDSAAKIEYRAFYDCNIETISFGNSITYIDREAFNNCVKLKAVNLPDTVTKIDVKAFQYCGSLTDVTLGKGLKELNGYAFADCSNLANVYCKATTPPTLTWRDFNGCSSLSHIYVPRESVEDYRSAEVWKNYAGIIEGYDFE